MGSIFNIDYERLIAWLLPRYLRRPRRIAWLWALTKPSRERYTRFMAYRDDVNWRATINSQKNRLQQALRQQFNDNSIVIVDAGIQFQPPFIYRSSEGQVAPIIYRASEGKTPLYLRQSEELLSAADFIVRIPQSLASQASTVYAFVDLYRAGGRTFRVEDFAGNVLWPT